MPSPGRLAWLDTRWRPCCTGRSPQPRRHGWSSGLTSARLWISAVGSGFRRTPTSPSGGRPSGPRRARPGSGPVPPGGRMAIST